MKIDINRYTIEDYMLLKDLIEDAYKHIEQFYNKPSILEFLDCIISGKINMEDPLESVWVSLKNRSFLYKLPLIFMPRCLNNKHRVINIIVRWRLQIGK